MAEAEHYATELLARESAGRSLRSDALLDVVFHARARERLRARFARPRDPAAEATLSEAQGEVIVEVITSALDELGLDAAQVFRARELIAAGLRAVEPPPELAAFVASLGAEDRTILRAAIDAEDARRAARSPAVPAAAPRHDGTIMAPYQPPLASRAR